MPTPLLRLTNISKSFAAVQALQQVSFELFPGEVHALVGENGAGKSTLVQVITGAQQPDAGTIEIDGRVVSHLGPAYARQLGIACIYQHPALFHDLTVAENIALRLEQSPALRPVHWKAWHRRAQQLLDRVGTEISPEIPVRELSLPQQQLVEIACALGQDARIILMDEPTASLTQCEQKLLFGLIRELRGQEIGVIYVSHRLEEIFALADRITVLRDGRRVSTCSGSELSESSLIKLMVGRELSSEQPGRSELRKEAPCVLSVRRLHCAISGLRDVSFNLRAGEILGLAGLVGAGRSELAQTLFGITPADSGEILLGGERVALNSPQSAVSKGIAYVPEDRTKHGIILDLPTEQNITMAIHEAVFPHAWLRPNAERQLATEYIRALDIKPARPDALAASLSGGNQQKVCVARWLAAKPTILILDEPTQGVDVGAKQEIHAIIRGLARQGMAVLLISSELTELLALCDRIGVMRAGRLVSILPGKTDPHAVMAAAFGQAIIN